MTYTTPDAARLPRVQSFTVGIAREVGWGLTMDLSVHRQPVVAPGAAAGQLGDQLRPDSSTWHSATCCSSRSRRRRRRRRGSQTPFPAFANQLGANTVAASLKPYPQYTSITANSTRLMEGKSPYDSVQVKATQRLIQRPARS